MVWIEMSKDIIHGGGEWGFTKCIWAPTYKQGKRKASWPFWSNILQVRHGDIVLHLREESHTMAFVGYSIAATDGHETLERPPQAGKWSYSTSYFRALLKDFQPFDNKLLVENFFKLHENVLKDYLQRRDKVPASCFYSYQNGGLHCLEGAYLSKCDDTLLALILHNKTVHNDPSLPRQSSATSEALHQVKQRIGQSQFSKAVKENYHYKCCFPDCPVTDPRFLVGSHIARWVDNPTKRGHTSNGLCLCPLHDRAFELGYFSLNNEYRVMLSRAPEVQTSKVFQKYIKPYEHQEISQAPISPDLESLAEHRFRCKITD